MKIPITLRESFPEKFLILATGEFEAKFFVAEKGEIDEKENIKLNPRDEAKENVGFVGKKGGMQSLSSVSHHGAYVLDTKHKFYKLLGETLEKIGSKENAENIYLFLPRYAKNKIFEKLPRSFVNKISETFMGEYVNQSPLSLMDMMKKRKEKDLSEKHIHLTKEEKKIVHRPKTRSKKIA